MSSEAKKPVDMELKKVSVSNFNTVHTIQYHSHRYALYGR